MNTLTPREREILRLICTDCQGRKEVATRLGIAIGTVKNHLAAIHRVTGLTTEQLCYRLKQAETAPDPEKSTGLKLIPCALERR